MTKEKDLLSDEITHYYYPVRVEEESISDHHLSLKVLPSEVVFCLLYESRAFQSIFCILDQLVLYFHVSLAPVS